MAAITGILVQYIVLYAVYAILALSFNIEYGFGGIPNFGKVLFVSLGAYSAGWLVADFVVKAGSAGLGIPVEASGMPAYCTGTGKTVMTMAVHKGVISPATLIALFIASLILAAIVGMVTGIVASYPALRLGGDFLAISLLALGEIVRIWAYNSQWPACSFNGISGIPGPFDWLGRIKDYAYAALLIVMLILVYIYVELATNSPWGRALKAMRDDEIAAEVYGYNVPRVRMQALAVGSALAAMAGALLVFYSGNVNANTYKPDMTFMVIVATLLGGAANNVGALIGAAIIAGIEVFLNPSSLLAMGITLPDNVALALPYMKYVLLGVIIVLVLLYRPQGLLPEKPLRTPIVEKAKQKLEEFQKAIQSQQK
ncbi:branched-chain amino acid ABC transporter permease [Pyrofollis japonicus]|uniref:branched-chain amino acid ABC transporter permease n=1 Tax=Pyrofollis japonicus TaxID=3060460 RepID=UPI00295B5CC8|nr:branched-chain amino acid ABC transporter permease [Pyrofollis japonicus]BEP18289.1 branched-chain amino acid ABC transporter permease [Pyrofollis japonicus]